jgi:hypothetical protein
MNIPRNDYKLEGLYRFMKFLARNIIYKWFPLFKMEVNLPRKWDMNHLDVYN